MYSTWATYQESIKISNYKKQPYWALNIYLWKLLMEKKYKTYFMGEVTHVTRIVNTEQLQHYIPYKHGLFQVYNCKHLA
jgi:hypothetical protein